MYKDIHLSLYEMQCYATKHRCELAINLESELSMGVTLYPLASNQMAHHISNARVG